MTITRIPGTRFVKALTRIGHRPYVLIRNSLLSRKNSRRCAAAAGGGEAAMSDASAIDAASRRLAAALDALEAAAERRREADHGEDTVAAARPRGSFSQWLMSA